MLRLINVVVLAKKKIDSLVLPGEIPIIDAVIKEDMIGYISI